MIQIRENVPLAELTTFKIGGPARFFARVATIQELEQALDFARAKNIGCLMLGGGSNLLPRDEGFNGLVIKVEVKGIEFADTVTAGAGESWDELVAQTVAHKLWGLENLSGIPGSVGGAIAGSIGAYGAAVGQHVVWVEAYDAQERAVKKFTAAECKFGYRDSIFSAKGGSIAGGKRVPQLVILRAAFDLSTAPKPELAYRDLAERFAGQAPTLHEVREAILAIRQGKFPDLNVEGTAGSFFKNPIVGEAQAGELRERYPQLPLFAMPEVAGYKVPVAWLMDHVLHMRGLAVEGARLFEKQILVIAAQKNTSSHAVRTLAERVKKEVKEKLDLEIEEEVRIL